MNNERFYYNNIQHGRENSFEKHRGKTISESDEALIRQFIDELSSTKHIGDMRANKIAFGLIGWRRFISKERALIG